MADRIEVEIDGNAASLIAALEELAATARQAASSVRELLTTLAEASGAMQAAAGAAAEEAAAFTSAAAAADELAAGELAAGEAAAVTAGELSAAAGAAMEQAAADQAAAAANQELAASEAEAAAAAHLASDAHAKLRQQLLDGKITWQDAKRELARLNDETGIVRWADKNKKAINGMAAAFSRVPTISEIRRTGLTGGEAALGARTALEDLRGKVRMAHTAVRDLDRSLAAAEHDAGRFAKALGTIGGAAGKLAGGLSSVVSGLTGAVGAIGSAMPGLQPWNVAIAGLVALVGALIPAAITLGAGIVSFGALALPALMKVKNGYQAVTQAQKAYTKAVGVAKRDPTKTNLAAEKTDLAKLRTAWAMIPPAVRPAVRAIMDFKNAWSQASKHSGIQKAVFKDIAGVLKDARTLIPSLTKVAQSFSPILSRMVKDLGQNIKSKPFQDFVKNIVSAMPKVAGAMHKVAGVVGNLFSMFMKPKNVNTSVKFLNSLSSMFKNFSPNMVNGLNGLASGMTKIVTAMNQIGKSGIGHNIGRFWNDLWQGLGFAQKFQTHMGTLKPFAGVGVKHVEQQAGQAGRSARKAFQQGMGRDPQGFKNLMLGKGTLNQASKGARQAGHKAGQEFAKGVGQGGKDAAKAAGQLAKAAVKGIQGIKGKLAGAVAHTMSSDIAKGMGQAKAAITQTIGKTIQTALSDAKGHATSGWAQITSAFRAGANNAAQAVAPLPGKINGYLAPLPGMANSIGAGIGQGLAAGIIASTGAAVAAARSMAAAVTAAAQVSLGVHSPSTVFAKIGKQTIQGFINGLLGGKSAVQAAMRLIFGVKPHDQHIRSMVHKLLREVHAAARAGVITKDEESGYTRLIRKDNKRLQKLAQERKRLENEIKAADALAKSVQNAAASGANVVASFGMTFAGQNQQQRSYPTIKKAMEANLKRIRQFRADIKKLKKEGLSKQIIKQLLGAGVEGGLPIAEQLLHGGRGGIKDIVRLQQEINKAAKKLGITGANAAYESGKQIGKGLAAGLKTQLHQIEKAMDRIAKELIRAIRRALRIKSPSEVMREIGMMTAAGLASGMDAATSMVRAAARRMGHGAVEGLALAPMRASASLRGGPAAAPVVHNHITLQIDGKAFARANQKFSLQHAHRNPATGLKLSGRGI